MPAPDESVGQQLLEFPLFTPLVPSPVFTTHYSLSTIHYPLSPCAGHIAGHLADSMAAARTKSDNPLNPFRFAAASNSTFSSEVSRTFT